LPGWFATRLHSAHAVFVDIHVYVYTCMYIEVIYTCIYRDLLLDYTVCALCL